MCAGSNPAGGTTKWPGNYLANLQVDLQSCSCISFLQPAWTEKAPSRSADNGMACDPHDKMAVSPSVDSAAAGIRG